MVSFFSFFFTVPGGRKEQSPKIAKGRRDESQGPE